MGDEDLAGWKPALPVPPMPPSASRCSFHFAIVAQMSDENLKKHKNN